MSTETRKVLSELRNHLKYGIEKNFEHKDEQVTGGERKWYNKLSELKFRINGFFHFLEEFEVWREEALGYENYNNNKALLMLVESLLAPPDWYYDGQEEVE